LIFNGKSAEASFYDIQIRLEFINWRNGDGFGNVECGIFAAHIVGAHFAFRDDTGDGGFKTRSHFGFL